jgi:(4S)-4-hydroxy-5-phosphonooxypentane-2,3-dione isomerase
MIVTTVAVFVNDGHLDDFITATLENHNNSLQEPGNLRFDILQSIEDPNRFTLYEAYESEEAAAAHKETGHYLRWRETVADWMEKPREGTPHRVLAPDISKWR